MTAAGDAVLAVARSRIGMTEDPPGSNAGPWWDWYGQGNLGSWCACFTSWCSWDAGFPVCPVNSAKGFVLVSSGTTHSYEGWETAQEARPTVDLQPGDQVLFSWYPWTWQGGVPVISSGEWSGWTAGDHVGFFSHWIDQSAGRFAAVEGNTGDGSVMERTDRYTSQVCGWWRPESYGSAPSGPGSIAPPKEDDDVYQTCLVTTNGHPWKGSVFMCAGGRAMAMTDENIVRNLQARGLAGPTIEVEAWDIYGGYEVSYASGPGAVPG